LRAASESFSRSLTSIAASVREMMGSVCIALSKFGMRRLCEASFMLEEDHFSEFKG
jgi:hypothetical protein